MQFLSVYFLRLTAELFGVFCDITTTCWSDIKIFNDYNSMTFSSAAVAVIFSLYCYHNMQFVSLPHYSVCNATTICSLFCYHNMQPVLLQQYVVCIATTIFRIYFNRNMRFVMLPEYSACFASTICSCYCFHNHSQSILLSQ